MTYAKKLTTAAAALLLTAVSLTAQAPTAPSGAPAAGRGGRGAAAPALKSPEVHPDRTVTFRFRAPQAPAVDLVGEITQGKPAIPMTKDSDGVWSVTIGPLPPEIWIYNFRIAGVNVADPGNISIMPRSVCCAIANLVEVPGDGVVFYDPRPVPHGDVRIVNYESKAMEVPRTMWIYTPPGYDKSTAKYPVYYLLHGNGETQEGWVTTGRANFILDNLIADGKAQPMIVVMPQGHAVQSARTGPLGTVPPAPGGPGMTNFTLFTTELIEQVIPMVEKNFRVIADADHRAIGGLSMGAMQSVSIGLSHPETFHYVLAYSGGFSAMGGAAAGAPPDPTAQAPWKDLLANPSETRKRLHLLFLGCGQQETAMLGPGQALVKAFQEKGINAEWADHPGGHMFTVWRHHLNETVPMLFKVQKASAKGTK